MRVLKPLSLSLVLATSAPLSFADDDSGKPDDSITFNGFTGLFNLISPDTLDSGQVSFGVVHRNWDRQNTDLDANDLSAAFAIGFARRLELGFSYVANRQMDYDDPHDSHIYNGFPFPTGTIEDGGGDLRIGLKAALLRMEEEGNGLSLFGDVKLPTGDQAQGFGTGGTDVRLGLAAGLVRGQVGLFGNVAYNLVGDAELDGADLDLANTVNWGAGLELGARHWLKGVFEVSGETYSSKPTGFPDQDEAIDLSVGFKLGGAGHSGVSFGAAYVYNATMDSDRADGSPTRPHGWVAALSFTTAEKPPAPPAPVAPTPVNHPPTCSLTVSPKEVFPAFSPKPHRASFTAQASDPDGDRLEYVWSASDGTVFGSGAAVEWSPAERTEEGVFTLTLRVRDGKGGEGSCSESVRVKPDPEFFDGRVQFEFDRYDLTPDGEAVVRKAADHLGRHPNLEVTVEGHTCYIATEEYNMALGQQRAESIKKALVGLGVAAGRLQTVSYGESRPWQDNTREITRRLNRRGEFRFRFTP